jgi:N-hydroxyarylamine O-acetyltransferase
VNLGPGRRDAYLHRLGFPAGIGDPTAEVLGHLQVAHLDRIPFENLDIHLGVPVVLDGDALARKLTERHRGGFCYELNGAFALLLEDLGFEVERLEARVYAEDGEVTIPFDHLVLRVVAEGRPYLVDVGFGDNFVEPVPFVTGVDHEDHVGTFRIDERDDGWFDLVQDGAPQHRFSPAPHDLDDFAEACTWHQTSADSHFTRNPVCTVRIRDGRVTLRGRRLIVTRAGEREEREVPVDELVATYHDRFGIDLPSEDAARLA